MKLSDAFPSNYLKSEDLQGRDVPVVIAGTEMEMLGNERKLVLSFQGKTKKMICNKTNAGRIAYLYGDELNDWIGREIVLTSEFVEFQGKTVKGLRVRPPSNARPAQQSHQAPPRQQFNDRKVAGATIMDSGPPPPDARPRDDMDQEIPF